MTYIEVQTQHIRNLLKPIIGDTNAKTYFSYYGIIKDNAMFALYKNNQFYLHLSPNDTNEAASLPDIIPFSDSKYGVNSKTFYLIPNDILGNLEHYSHWIHNSIRDILETKQQQYIEKKKNIRTLPNMTIQLERTLKRLGIYSIDDLVQRGEIDVFVNLLKIGIDVDRTVLFKLHGAINRQYLYTIPEKKKLHLLNEADNALYNQGMRKRFNIKS